MKKLVRLILSSYLFLGMILLNTANAQVGTQDVISITDITGYKHYLKEKPCRIISLNTSSDEILFALVEQDRILGICNNSIDANMSSVVDKAQQIEVKLPLRSNCEVILGLAPDLVLFPEGGPREMVDSLRDLGVRVFVVRASNNIEKIKEKIREISIVVGEEEKGRSIIKEMNRKLESIRHFSEINNVTKKVVLGFTFAGAYGNVNGLFHDICVHAGVINGAAQMGLKMGERLSAEQVMKVNPDMVFLPTWSHHKNNNPEAFKNDFINNEPYKNLKAVKNGNVYLLDEKYRGCGSQYVVDGIVKIHELAYGNKL